MFSWLMVVVVVAAAATHEHTLGPKDDRARSVPFKFVPVNSC